MLFCFAIGIRTGSVVNDVPFGTSEPSLTAFDLLKTKTEMKNSPLFFIFYQITSVQIIKNLYIVPDN